MLYVCFKLMWIFPSTLRGSSEVLRPYFSKHNEVESMAAHVHLNSAAPKSTSSYSREKLKIILIYAVYCAQLQNSKLIKIERSYSFIGKIPKACFIYRIKRRTLNFVLIGIAPVFTQKSGRLVLRPGSWDSELPKLALKRSCVTWSEAGETVCKLPICIPRVLLECPMQGQLYWESPQRSRVPHSQP